MYVRLSRILADLQRGEFAEFYDVPQVSAAALVVRTSALEQAGPFDPIFGSYYEDYDLCRRLRAAGYRVGICSRGVVYHYNGSSTTTAAAQSKRMRQIIRNRAIHRIRSSSHGRVRTVLNQFIRVLPWNAARGLARTPSSQPVGVQLAAHYDLMRILDRLVFEDRDRQAWREYLLSIGWEQATRRSNSERGRSAVS
ncbi:MAG: glycosyltransferase family 2 protein [Planctomycetaceae bacterium]